MRNKVREEEKGRRGRGRRDEAAKLVSSVVVVVLLRCSLTSPRVLELVSLK
jgi:hypothetical protein